MPTTTISGDGMSRDDVLSLYASLGLRPIGGGSGEGDAENASGEDTKGENGKEGDANADAAGSDKGDGKAGDEDVAGLKSALATERDAAKTLKRELKAIRDELNTLKNAGKTDTEKIAAERDLLKDQLDTLTAKQREANGREVVRTAALRMGADPKKVDLIYRAVRGDLDYGDGDDPKNVTSLLNDLKTEYPDQFRAVTGKADAGAGNGSKPKDDPNAALRRAAGRTG